MRILLLSAYDAHSHRRWREGLVAAFPEHDWTVLTLPPQNFLWRVRGNSLSWAFGERETLMQPYDLVIATSMTDFSALRGMVPSLAGVPTLVYCHENQFAYPDRRTAERNEPKLVSLYSVLAADCVVFNSSYNRDTFLEGVEAFLAKMPDHVPPGITGRIRERSTVIPVPMESTWFAGERRQPQDGPLVLVWNHRWEYDKGPEILFAALIKLQEAGTDFRIHVIGQQFREQPPVFSEMHEKLKPHIASWGFVKEEEEYRRILCESNVVLSTALHEFQGLAVQEAVACGCIPLVPDRLAYPEFFGPEYRYPSVPDDSQTEGAGLAE
ncbi:MAG: DUF3524 domain-containing protein, partial [Thiohalobacterales bacterium]